MKILSGLSRAALAGAAVVFMCTAGVQAAPVGGTGNVTPEVIFGTGGNLNGSFTGVQMNNVEVGLRAKQRYPTPQNIFNYDGDHTYTFDSTVLTAPAGRSIFNFEWSINSDLNETSGRKISAFTYALSVELNGVMMRAPFDPYDGSTKVGPNDWYDHAFGDNSTANSGGTEATDAASFAALKDGNTVSQQSWNMGFEELVPLALIQSTGIFTITLDMFHSGNLIASSSIDVRVNPVPLPAALPLFGAGLAGMGLIGWRRKRRGAVAA